MILRKMDGAVGVSLVESFSIAIGWSGSSASTCSYIFLARRGQAFFFIDGLPRLSAGLGGTKGRFFSPT